jgi:16S rRNA (guanine(966)-N(2))-methyltransferase RsmD
MRIISGRFRSRHLKATPPAGLRPTSDKLRETLFNILGETVINATFLDACAGMGAVGIEALSRGAAHVYFVDQSRKACRIIRENLRLLQVDEGCDVLESDLGKALDIFARDRVAFDIAFLDPPYDRDDLYEETLRRFSAKPAHPLLTTHGTLVIEHSKRTELPQSAGALRQVRALVQGDSALAFYRLEEQ